MIFISEFSLSSVKSRFCRAKRDRQQSFLSALQHWCAQELPKLDIKTCLTRCCFKPRLGSNNFTLVVQKIAESD